MESAEREGWKYRSLQSQHSDNEIWKKYLKGIIRHYSAETTKPEKMSAERRAGFLWQENSITEKRQIVVEQNISTGRGSN